MKRLIVLFSVALTLPALAQYGTDMSGTTVAAGGAITQVEAQKVALPNTASGVATITLGTSTTSGELIVAGVGSPSGSNSLTSCTDSASQTYTQVILQNSGFDNAHASNGYIQLYYHANSASGVTTVSCTESNGTGEMFVAHVKNLTNHGTLDVNAGAAFIIFGGQYNTGGTHTGSSTQTCNLASFNGGGSGATATVALTGTNVIASGTAITQTAGGTGYTSAPTSATLSSGTATCSGTATLQALLLDAPASPWNSSPVTTTVAAEYIVGVLYGGFNGTNCATSASGSWTQDQVQANIGGTGSNAAFYHQIVSSTQAGIQTTGTDTGTCSHYALIASFN